MVPQNFKNSRKNSLENEHIENNSYQSVIEIDEKDFTSKWRTSSYSDEM